MIYVFCDNTRPTIASVRSSYMILSDNNRINKCSVIICMLLAYISFCILYIMSVKMSTLNILLHFYISFGVLALIHGKGMYYFALTANIF